MLRINKKSHSNLASGTVTVIKSARTFEFKVVYSTSGVSFDKLKMDKSDSSENLSMDKIVTPDNSKINKPNELEDGFENMSIIGQVSADDTKADTIEDELQSDSSTICSDSSDESYNIEEVGLYPMEMCDSNGVIPKVWKVAPPPKCGIVIDLEKVDQIKNQTQTLRVKGDTPKKIVADAGGGNSNQTMAAPNTQVLSRKQKRQEKRKNNSKKQ